MTILKFKPKEVEAHQLQPGRNGGYHSSTKKLMDWILENNGQCTWINSMENTQKGWRFTESIGVNFNDKFFQVCVGHWVVRDEKGNLTGMTDEELRDTYE